MSLSLAVGPTRPPVTVPVMMHARKIVDCGGHADFNFQNCGPDRGGSSVVPRPVTAALPPLDSVGASLCQRKFRWRFLARGEW